MNRLTLFSAIALTGLANAFAEPETTKEQTTAPKEASAPKPQINPAYQDAIDAFSNLPEKTRFDFMKKRNEANILFQNKRIIEALEQTRQLQEIFPSDPVALNLRGACYVEIRNFDKAREMFHASMNITGPTINVVFNLGEVEFVSSNWSESLAKFEQALELAPERAIGMRRLIEFKLLLSHIGLSKDSKLDEATRKKHTDAALSISEKYDYRDDSPFAYYAKAAILYSQGDDTAGLKERLKALRIYSSSPQAISSWEDTLTEFGYVKSYYGNEQAPGQ